MGRHKGRVEREVDRYAHRNGGHHRQVTLHHHRRTWAQGSHRVQKSLMRPQAASGRTASDVVFWCLGVRGFDEEVFEYNLTDDGDKNEDENRG